MNSHFDKNKPGAIGSDHAGFDYKEDLISFLEAKEILYHDFGTHSKASVDYPDFALAVADYNGLLKWKRRLTDLGLSVEGPLDRHYFKSIYFNDPDGTILEIATQGDAGIVDQESDPRMRRQDRGRQGGDGLSVGHVDAMAADTNAMGLSLRGRFEKSFLLDVGQSEMEAALGERQRKGAADSAAGAGHDRCLPLKPHHGGAAAPGVPNFITPSSSRPKLKVIRSNA